MKKKANKTQRMVFQKLRQASELIVSFKTDAISVDLVGGIVLKTSITEDTLYVQNSPHHFHVDWSRLTQVTYDNDNQYHEGCLTFMDDEAIIFKVFNPSGDFNAEIMHLFENNTTIELVY
ncbi:hypothetical protein [Cysteiniphilum sp. 6C5]|uniref:hypothetical protein n=1 Tax=unclassified Cysteiniphilum TaxID=2610889 RepID=UPI003F85D82E